jgi:hypothetical protein
LSAGIVSTLDHDPAELSPIGRFDDDSIADTGATGPVSH